MQRRKEIVKGKGLSLDIAPNEELSGGSYSSIEEFHEKETLPQKHRIKNRYKETYPSLFEYPHQIPTHHTADNLSVDEQQGLQKRIQSKARQEKGKKSKTKRKRKQESSRPTSPIELDNFETYNQILHLKLQTCLEVEEMMMMMMMMVMVMR